MMNPEHTDDGQAPLSPWQRFLVLYFKFLNFMLRRVVALWFMVLGSIATVMAVIWALLGKPIDVNGVPTTSMVARLLYVAAFLIPTVLGYLLWCSKPFDPHNHWITRR
ncbi:MAG: hypothetical protein ACM3ZT_06350 [Bacillota bacterium]